MFKDEITDHIESISKSLSQFEKNNDVSVFEEVQRRLHTIKGSAYMIGLEEPGKLAHVLEDTLKGCSENENADYQALVSDIFQAVDLLADYVEEGINESEEVGDDGENVASASSSLALFIERLKGNRFESKVSDKPVSSKPVEVSSVKSLSKQGKQLDEGSGKQSEYGGDKQLDEADTKQSEGTVRVEIEKLDKLLELASELVTFQSRLAAKTSYNSEFAEEMSEFGYLVEDIHCQTMEARMMPVESIVEGFYRTFRTVARDLGKKARLKVTGKGVEVDKRILELVKPIIIHTLRNALDHGIESSEDRIKLGKLEEGLIQLDVSTDGRLTTFAIRDDGRGINIEKLASKAVEMGVISVSQVVNLSEQKILEFIFLSGLSTAGKLSTVSGRGVGMDVVKRSVEEMKGTLNIESKSGHGTTLSFSVPTSLSVINALMVEANGDIFALPVSGVVETVRFTVDDIVSIGKNRGIKHRGEAILLSYLPCLLGFLPKFTPHSNKINAVILKSRSEQLTLVVDKILGDQEIVVKSLGDHIRSVPFVSGATFLPSGLPSLILQIPELLSRAYSSFSTQLVTREEEAPARILIVDDSPTTQMMETSILKEAGYIPSSVSSAEEAMDLLIENQNFDLFVVDIEMPGKNGVELISWMKNDGRFSHIPKILMSSAKEHYGWSMAEELGIGACIFKQDFNQEQFLASIRRLLQKK